MSIHKATHMRIHNDANMSFHKDRQSPPLIEATRAAQRFTTRAATECRHQKPLPPAAGAPCTTSQSPPCPGSTRRAHERRGQRHHAVLIGLRACGSHPPIVCLGRHHQTQPPSHGRGGSQPPHPLTTRMVSTAPAVRAGTGGANPPGAICCQVMHQPATVTVSALPGSDDGGSSPGAAVVAVAAAALGAAVGVATAPP